MWEAIAAIGLPILKALVPFLIGWLMPSPIQRAANDQADIKNKEDAADDPKGDSTQLDNFP